MLSNRHRLLRFTLIIACATLLLACRDAGDAPNVKQPAAAPPIVAQKGPAASDVEEGSAALNGEISAEPKEEASPAPDGEISTEPKDDDAGNSLAKEEQQDEGGETSETDLTASRKNLKEIGLAMHDFSNERIVRTLSTGVPHPARRNQLPPRVIRARDGTALLSWRVLLLKYLEPDLYKQFRLDEPWDSEHNRQLLKKMPDFYKTPGGTAEPGKTHYVVPVGETTGYAARYTEGIKFIELRDGMSRTVAVVEADEAVAWTKPEDLAFDSTAPHDGLGKLREVGFLAMFFDITSRFIPNELSDEAINVLMTPTGGEAWSFAYPPQPHQHRLAAKPLTKEDDGHFLGGEFSADGSRLVLVTERNTHALWDVDNEKLIESISVIEATSPRSWRRKPEFRNAHGAALSADGETLAFVFDDMARLFSRVELGNKVELSSLAEYRPVRPAMDEEAFALSKLRLRGAAFAEKSPLASALSELRKRGGSPWETTRHDPRSFEMSPDAAQVATLTYGGRLEIWDAASGQPLRHAQLDADPQGSVSRGSGESKRYFHVGNHLRWSPTGDLLIVPVWQSNKGYALAIYNAAKLELLRSISLGDATFRFIEFSADGRHLVGVCSDWLRPTIKIWDARTGAVAEEIYVALTTSGLAFSPERKLLATQTTGQVSLWDLSTLLP